jgi:hypothetical protein
MAATEHAEFTEMNSHRRWHISKFRFTTKTRGHVFIIAAKLLSAEIPLQEWQAG